MPPKTPSTPRKIQTVVNTARFDYQLSPALQAFLLDAHARRLTPASLTYYQDRVSKFLEWLEQEHPECTTLQDIDANHLREYLIHLEKRGLAGASQHSSARALKAWLNWCVREEYLITSPMRSVRMPRVEERILTAFSEKDARRIVNACKTPRDTAIVLCLLDTGCRAREFISLNVEDVDLQTGAVIVLHGKGRKERTVYLGQKARKALSRYLASRPRPRPQDPLWASQGPNRDPNNERLSVWGLQQMLRRIGRHSGVPNCHPHTFRRTFALWSLRAGMNIYALQQLMGHADLTILRHYLPLVESDLRQAHEQFGAVDQWL